MSEKDFDRTAYLYTPNVTQGWEHGLATLVGQGNVHKKILDVGCGNVGELLLEGSDVWGVDPNLGTLRFNGDGKNYGPVAIAVPGRSKVAFAEDLPFPDDIFDYALSTKAVGWYPRQINTALAIAEMLRVIKRKTGSILFNIGQEMTPEIIKPILANFSEKGIEVMIRESWCVMRHPKSGE